MPGEAFSLRCEYNPGHETCLTRRVWTAARVLLAVLGASYGASGCGNFSPSEPTSGPPCNRSISGGTFSAVIDGKAWSTTSLTGNFRCGSESGINWLEINSSSPPSPYYSFRLELTVLRTALVPGSYPVEVGWPTAHASLDRNDATGFRVWLTGPLTSGGSATVSIASRERATGSFEFVLAPGALVKLPEDMRTISVTNGTFDVRF